MRSLLTFFCLLFLTACSSISKQEIALNKPQNSASDFELLLSSEIEARLALDQFLLKNSNPTELQKIDYLLERIKTSSVHFFRNNEQYDGSTAAKWLRWKMHHKQYAQNPIRTAYRFVHEVADGSRQTGLPYRIIFTNGDYVKSEVAFQDELKLLENEIRKRNMESVIKTNSIDSVNALSNESFIAPVLLNTGT